MDLLNSVPIVWFLGVDGNSWCPLRLAGDLCLLVSNPFLIYKLYKNGAKGISVETQVLRLIMLVTRYLDLFVYGRFISNYNTYMKVALVVSSLYLVISLIFWHKAYNSANLQAGILRFALPLSFAMVLALMFTYNSSFLEVAWAFSQYIKIVADIPQLILMFNPNNRDWKMVTYIGLLSGFIGFYILHWVGRYVSYGIWDPISSVPGFVEAMILVVAWIGMYWSHYKHSRSSIASAEEGISDTPKVLVMVDDSAAGTEYLDEKA